jgi:hypothetical protein
MISEARKIAAEQGLYAKAAQEKQRKEEEYAASQRAAVILQKKKEAAEEMYEALTYLVDDDPCQFDHHGNCQTHYLGNLCGVAMAKKALAKARGEEETKWLRKETRAIFEYGIYTKCQW